MRCLAQKSINSHQGHPRLPPTQRDGNTVGTPLVHRSPAVYQRWTNPDLSAQTARAAVRRSVGRGGVPTLSRVTHRNGTARRMPGRRPGRRGEPEPGEHRRDRLWHAVGKDRSHRLGFGGPQVGGSGGVIGACAAKSARLPRVESGHGMYGVYLESLEDTTPGRNSGWSGWNRSARSRMNAS